MTMTDKIEIRVRPVQRHLVTVWQEGLGSRVVGEFESPTIADEVAMALQAKTPRATVVDSEGAVKTGSEREFVIVGLGADDVKNVAFFAYSDEEAEKSCKDAELSLGRDFAVFSRLKTD